MYVIDDLYAFQHFCFPRDWKCSSVVHTLRLINRINDEYFHSRFVFIYQQRTKCTQTQRIVNICQKVHSFKLFSVAVNKTFQQITCFSVSFLMLQYLIDLITPYSSPRAIQTQDTAVLSVPSKYSKTMFLFQSSPLCNGLPANINNISVQYSGSVKHKFWSAHSCIRYQS